MLDSLLRRLYRRWAIHSLSAKLLVPSIGLMILSLLGSTLTFVGGTALTRNSLLKQHSVAEAERVTQILNQRVASVATAASLLANDPEVVEAVQGESETALNALNSRAVVVRDRFGMALIQIYDRHGQARTNLMLSSLYRESSMLNMAEPDKQVVRVVGDRLLLLGGATMPDETGSVVVGVDLETELKHILAEHRLSSDLSLSVRGISVGTGGSLPSGADEYRQSLPISLGSSSAELLLVRPTTDVKRVTNMGLLVMVGSTLLTTLLLSGLNVAVIRSIARPIHHLSVTAEAVAQGDLNQELPLSFAAGDKDEIGLLARTFNRMVAELRDLYGNLEAKVEARTRELATTAEVAKSVSSSLEMDVILERSARIIQERLDACYVGVFLTDRGSNLTVLRKSIGGEGKNAKKRKVSIPLGSRSPVGIASATGKPKIIQNVRTVSEHLKPPLLMDTQSAAAIPLLVGGTTIGALDVQCQRCDAFDADRARLLTTLADQLATGVHNARLYDQQRRAVEHLAEVDRLKTEFLAVMSHELRTPLNTIIGFSKVLLKGLDGPLTEKQEQDLSIIHESGQHLLSLIRDILDVSQINAGQIELEIERVKLGKVIDGALGAIQPLIEDKPVTLCKDIDPELPVIRADERRVRQIMLNLLSNAAKFTESGQISIRARVIEALNVEGEGIEPFVEVSVIDTGVGIPEDKLVQIFEEFTQVDSSSTRRFEGTGLGLPITKKLVELHEGRIWVESEPGQGSAFTFILPVNRPRFLDPRSVYPSSEGIELEIRQEVEYEMAV
jgi:signal transduction histidine kinase/HAMP domain-containing protein